MNSETQEMLSECLMSLSYHLFRPVLNSVCCCVYSKSKKEDKDQESIQSRTTPDTGYQWESDNVTIRHHKREQRGQPFPSR